MGGNQMKMREALELCYRIIHCAMVAGVINRDDANKAMDAYHSALSAPPRQCDVGTAEEQEDRFLGFCKQGMCEKCEIYKRGQGLRLCHLRWAQTPYEAKRKGATA